MTKDECEHYLGNAALVVGRLPDDVNVHLVMAPDGPPTVQIATDDQSEIHFDYEHYDAENRQTVFEFKTQGTTVIKYVPDKEEESCDTTANDAEETEP